MQLFLVTITQLLQINKSRPKLLDFPNHPFRFVGRVTKSVPDWLRVPSPLAIFEIAVTLESSTCCAALQISVWVIRLIWLMQLTAGRKHHILHIPNTVNTISVQTLQSRRDIDFLRHQDNYLPQESVPSWTLCTSMWSLLSINCLWNWQIKRKISKRSEEEEEELGNSNKDDWILIWGIALITLNSDSVGGCKSWKPTIDLRLPILNGFSLLNVDASEL